MADCAPIEVTFDNGPALAAILAKLSSDPATQTTLAAVLAKLAADPATQTTLAAILAKLPSAPATAAAQSPINDELKPISAGAALGTLVKTRPAGATAIVLDLPSGSSLSFVMASTQPIGAPATTDVVTVSGSDFKQYSRALGPGINMYVITKTGAITGQYI